jgi:hypothetical protein
MPEQAVKTVLKKAVLVAICDLDERLFSAWDFGKGETRRKRAVKV